MLDRGWDLDSKFSLKAIIVLQWATIVVVALAAFPSRAHHFSFAILFEQSPPLNPMALDRCLNKGIVIGPYEWTKDDKQLNETTQLNSRVYFINFMWNPRVSWVWEFNSL